MASGLVLRICCLLLFAVVFIDGKTLPEENEDLSVQLDELEQLINDEDKKDCNKNNKDADPVDNILRIDADLEEPYMIGGDMLFNKRQIQQAMAHNPEGVQGDVTTVSSEKWPSTGNIVEIPFVYGGGGSNGAVTRRTKDVIDKAIAEFTANTCIRFVARTNQRDYLNIINGEGCYSYVGRQGGSQDVSLLDRGSGAGCFFTGTAIHEFMHALGWFHEQSRDDRDTYITINYANIDQNFVYNFNKMNTNKQGLTYDTESIMHYGSTAFSVNGQPTIVKKDGSLIRRNPNEGFTQLDLDGINKFYCSDTTKPTTNPPPVGGTTPAPVILNTVVLPDKEVICPVMHQLGLCRFCFAFEYCQEYCVNTPDRRTGSPSTNQCTEWVQYCNTDRYWQYMWHRCPTTCRANTDCMQ